MLALTVIGLIRVYQRISGSFGHRCCRFYPSCSQYAIDAISKFGVIKGGVKAIYRILRCQPLSQGGVDPVR